MRYKTCEETWRERCEVTAEQKQYVNVYGVVRDATAVSKTRGSDSKMTLKVYDETTPTEATKFGGRDADDIPSELTIVFFDQNPFELPRPADGDVIRIHRLQAQLWEGRPQFVAKTGSMLQYGHSKTSWCLFRGDDDSEEPYSQSSVKASNPDVKRVQALRVYARKAKTMPFMNEFGNAAGGDTKMRRICDIKEKEFFDIYCLILDAHFVEGTEGCYVMYVWDGTDAPPLPSSMTTSLSSTREDIPIDERDFQVQSELDKRKFYPHGFNLGGQDIVPEGEMNTALPLIGTALPVFMHSDKLEVDEIPAPGEWVKIRNLNTQIVRGQLQGFVRRETSFIRNKTPLQPLLDAYTLRKGENVVTSWGMPGHSTTLTVTKHPNMRYSTIREMLMMKPPMRHKLRVIVRGVSPNLVDMCQPGKGGTYEFGVRFRIIDATDSVDVNLCGEEAKQFFHNVVPMNLKKPSATRERLNNMLSTLLKHDSIEDSAAWIDLCVMQYIVRDGKTARRAFQVFGTSMI